MKFNLILESIGVCYTTNRGRAFWWERTTYEKEFKNNTAKPAGMVQGLTWRVSNRSLGSTQKNRGRAKKFIQGTYMSLFEFMKDHSGRSEKWPEGNKNQRWNVWWGGCWILGDCSPLIFCILEFLSIYCVVMLRLFSY